MTRSQVLHEAAQEALFGGLADREKQDKAAVEAAVRRHAKAASRAGVARLMRRPLEVLDKERAKMECEQAAAYEGSFEKAVK